MTDDWTGKRVAFVGALAAMPRRLAARDLAAAGGLPRRRIGRGTDVVVVGRGAVRLLAGGRLTQRLAAARRIGAEVLSEERFLERLVTQPVAAANAAEMSPAQLAARSGLSLDTLPLLIAFGLLQEVDGGFGFQALVTAREIAQLLDDGVPLETLIHALVGLGDERLAREYLRRRRLATRGGELVRLSGGEATELDGQRRLDFGGEVGPTADDLFDEAEDAEAAGADDEAAVLYRRCAQLDPDEPSAAFNLGNLLRERGETAEAERCFLRALAADPAFAEAWYNLAGLRRQTGRLAAAGRALDAACAADPGYADAYYNRADLAWEAGDLAAAERDFRRYLELDAESDWAAQARKRLALCRGAGRPVAQGDSGGGSGSSRRGRSA